MAEDVMVGWHYQFNGYEFEHMSGAHEHMSGAHEHMSRMLGGSEGQGSLASCSPWGCKQLDMTQQLNNKYPSTFLPINFIKFSVWY